MHKAGDGWLFFVAKRRKAANDLPPQSGRMGCIWKRWDAVFCARLLSAFGQVTSLHLSAQSGKDSCHLFLASSLQLDAYFGPFY